MLFGRFLGIIFAVVGVLLTIAGLYMLDGAGFTLRLFLAGPAMIFIGLSMVALPGHPVTLAESREAAFDPRAFIRNAPLLHKIIWSIAGLLGVAISLVLVV